MRFRLGEIGRKIASLENINIPEKFGPVRYIVDEHRVKTYAFTQDYYPYSFNESLSKKQIIQADILLNDLASLYYLEYDPDTNVGLHTEEEIWFHNPVYINEEVTISGAYTNKYFKNGNGYVVMDCEAKGEDGRKLITRRGIEIFGDKTGIDSSKKEETFSNKKKSSESKKDIVTGEYDKNLRPVKHINEDLKIGYPIQPLYKQITPEQAAVYSFAGDYLENIHNNLDYARKADLEFPIIQALQQVGYLLEMLVNFFGELWYYTGWIKVKFIRPVRTDDSLTMRGVLKGIEEKEEKQIVNLEIWTENSNGEMTAVGWASAHK